MRRTFPRGMALVAVLWIVAALSVMVMALAGTTRVQVRTASAQRDAAIAQAAGEAATALALQELLAQPALPDGVHTTAVHWQGMDIPVQVMPLNGYIGLNNASAELLAAVLQSAGAGNAQALAEAIISWRDGTDALPGNTPRQRRFEAVEDLMLVPGMDYTLYSRIAPLLSVDANGAAVNARGAPAEVLHALAGGQDVRVDEYTARRDQPDADASFLPPAFVGTHVSVGRLYRVRADVPLSEGTIARSECDVSLLFDMQRRLPWSLLRQSWRTVAPQL